MATLKEAYEQMGADYSDVLKRLMNDALVTRFATKFLDDASFDALKEALEAGDAKQAFMAAHTLKGVCSNLGFTNLYEPVYQITETLRGGSLEGSDVLFPQVEAEYNKTVEALKSAL
ncbi:MAG: Hpt domain-containing protein [Coriobacteriia bacterium]|nr:Hpt domain-containing protein [Coriobacteriia bacterium]